MTVPNRRKRGRKRRSEELKFAYSGPFAPLLDPAVGRALPVTDERYIPDSVERYDVSSAIGEELTRELGVRFGSNAAVTNRPKRRRRGGRGRRGGVRRVAS
jgi:hypothetical protein